MRQLILRLMAWNDMISNTFRCSFNFCSNTFDTQCVPKFKYCVYEIKIQTILTDFLDEQGILSHAIVHPAGLATDSGQKSVFDPRCRSFS